MCRDLASSVVCFHEPMILSGQWLLRNICFKFSNGVSARLLRPSRVQTYRLRPWIADGKLDAASQDTHLFFNQKHRRCLIVAYSLRQPCGFGRFAWRQVWFGLVGLARVGLCYCGWGRVGQVMSYELYWIVFGRHFLLLFLNAGENR